MSLKNKNPSELARGLVFQELFTSAANIALNRGVVTGALEYRDKGAYFDGTNDYITYANKGNLSQQSYLSFVIEFTPAFAHNDGADHFFFDTTAGARTVFYKSAASQLIFNFFGTGVFVLAAAAYSAYWKTNQRNVFVIAGTTGAQKMYLNGVEVGSASTAYTKATNTNFYIGASNAGTLKFIGVMHSFKIFISNISALTAQEALDYYTNQTFNYNKRATFILPMTADCHDATNVRTLDVSGKGNHFTFGDGSTASTFPTKLARRGYSFDGGDYMTRAPVQTSGNTITVCALIDMTSIASEQSIVSQDRTDGAAPVTFLLHNYSGNFQFYSGNASASSAANFPNQKGLSFLVGQYDGTSTKIWRNLVAGTNAATPIALAYNALDVSSIGRRANGTVKLAAGNNVLFAAVFPFALTPLQVADLHLKLQKNINLI